MVVPRRFAHSPSHIKQEWESSNLSTESVSLIRMYRQFSGKQTKSRVFGLREVKTDSNFCKFAAKESTEVICTRAMARDSFCTEIPFDFSDLS
jgi:hypothetical protein